MQLKEFLLAQLEREAASSRQALQRVPEGHNDWKPHDRSMPIGYLASLAGLSLKTVPQPETPPGPPSEQLVPAPPERVVP